MRIRTKLGLGFGVQILLAAVMGISVILGMLAVKRQFSFVVEHDDPIISNARQLSKLVIDMETGQRGFCITQNEEFLEPYNSGIKEFDVLMEQERKLVSDNPRQTAALARIELCLSEWKQNAAEPEIAMARKVAVHQIDAERLEVLLEQDVGKRLMDSFMTLGHEVETYFSDQGDWKSAFVVEHIEKCMTAREDGQRGYLITGKEIFLEKYNQAQQTLPKCFAQLRTIVSQRDRDEDLAEKVNKLEQLAGEWTKQVAEPEIAVRKEMNKHPETFKDVAVLLQAGTGKTLLDQMRREFADFIEIEITIGAEHYKIASDTTERTRNVAAGLLVLAICVGVVVALLISRAIAHPLVELAEGAQAIGHGDLDTQVKVRSSDEIGVLASAFNTMASNLKDAAHMRMQAEIIADTSATELKHRTVELEKSHRIAMGMMEDAQQAKQMAEHVAAHDALTGLSNRVQFTLYLEQAISRHHDDAEYRFALLFLDFDRFRVINDSLGHVAGDKLLIEFAGRLSNALRQSRADSSTWEHDIVARLGGDEFAILIGDISSIDDATHVADRLQHKISEPFDIEGHEVVISASIGIVTNEYDYTNPQDLIRDADNAMYHAKAAGRARYQIFDQAMHYTARARLELENDLRKALQRDELFVLYQPLVCMESGRLLGFEAMIRWQHAQRGVVSPFEFIPIAEETGLIVSIGQWVLEQACAQLSMWIEQFPDHHDLTINVNVSRAQLAQPGLPQHVQKVLKQTRLDPKHLGLEVTESVMMESHDIVDDTLEKLTNLNVPLHLDDFGTGQSSLSQLHELPINALKIDRAFVANMSDRIEYPAIIQTIIALAHNLDMIVIAEGIETPEQLVPLQALECDIGQGYYFARPMSAAAATAVLADGLSLSKSA